MTNLSEITITGNLLDDELVTSVNRKTALADMLCGKISDVDRILIDIVIRKCFIDVRQPPSAVGMTVNFVVDGVQTAIDIISWIDGCDRTIEFNFSNRKTIVDIPW